jgi:superfamily I DNA/RNA helicase
MDIVLSGAGTGKTTFIVNKAMSFMQKNMLILTKTNAAKEPIVNKIQKKDNVYVLTVDSFMSEYIK